MWQTTLACLARRIDMSCPEAINLSLRADLLANHRFILANSVKINTRNLILSAIRLLCDNHHLPAFLLSACCNILRPQDTHSFHHSKV